jgi:hypothetical protein
VFALLSLLALVPGSTAQEPENKALVLFIDGFLPAALVPEVAPNLVRLKDEGAWSLRARCEDTTISGSGWSTFLTGVHRDKHGVPDNAFAAPCYAEFPHFFTRLREARPGTVCASAQSWKPIQDLLVAPAAPDFNFFAEYDLASADYFDAFSVDTLCADAGVDFLKLDPVDVVVVMFDESDGVAHSEENAHYDGADPLYRRKLAEIDAHVGRLLAAIEARPSRAHERWLIAVHADHAGAKGEGHGLNTPAHREAPFILHGPGIARGEIWPPPKSPDLVASILHHFGVAMKAEWQLDGRAVGFAQEGPPLAWFHQNLLINGDAEAERGFAPELEVDASVLGWNDPGAIGVMPVAGGQSFFGGEAASMSQRIDLLPLRPWLLQKRLILEHSPQLSLVEIPGADGRPRWLETTLTLKAGEMADALYVRALPKTREALPEWRPLFDGQSLAGWQNVNVDADTFTVRDGMIVCSGVPTGEIRSERTYENFVVEFEYRHLVTGGNAGFFIWSDALPAKGAPFIRSVEVQVIDGWESENWTSHGDVFAIWGATMKPDRPHPAGWERCLPAQRRANGTGEWNHFRIVAVDGVVQHWVNRQPVSGGFAVSPRKGYLCLESEGSETHFRNLRILELPSTGATPEQTAASDGGFVQMPLTAAPRGWSRQDWRWAGEASAAAFRSAEEYDNFDVFLDVKVTGAKVEPPARLDPSRAGLIIVPIDRFGFGPEAGWRRIEASYRNGAWTQLLLDGAAIEFSVPFEATPARGPIGLIPPGPVPCEIANVFVRRVLP